MVALDVHEDMQRLANSGVVVVMCDADTDAIIDVADTLHEGDVTAHEIAADNPDAMDLIREVSASFSDNETIVSAGAALDAPAANAAIQAGAEFVVGPNSGEGVIETYNRYGTLVAPDIMTPTETTDTYSAGADFVKMFPASSLGPSHLKSVKGPLPQIPVMSTSGVGLDSAADYTEAGAVVVNTGGAFMDDEVIENGDFETITETTREFSDIINDARDG